MEPPAGRGFIGAGLRVLRSLSPRGPLLPWSSPGPARSSSSTAQADTAALTQLPEVHRPLAPRAPSSHSAPRRHRSHTPRRPSVPTPNGHAASPSAASTVNENVDQSSQLPPQLPALDAIEAGRQEISRVTPPLISPLPLPSGPPPCGLPPSCPPEPPSRGRNGTAEECSQHTFAWQAQPAAHSQGAGVGLAAPASSSGEHAQKLLDAVFEFPVAEQAAAFMLDANPELSWLSQCVVRCPLPPCWSMIESRNSFEATRYVDMGTGTVTEVQPLLGEFIELARMMLFWRSNPDQACSVAEALSAKCTEAFAEAAQLREAFMGPYVDPKSGAEFWHCSATHRSTWGDPGAASDFLARVAEKLCQALPVDLAECSSSSAQDRRETPWKAPPGKYHPPLLSGGVSPARAKYHTTSPSGETSPASAQAPLSRSFSSPSCRGSASARSSTSRRHERSRGAHTARQRSPARALSSSADDRSEETLGDVGAAVCDERSRRRRKCQSAPGGDLPAEDQAQQWWASSMADPFDSSPAPADLQLRPECRRRRPESRERLQPLDTEAQKPQQQIEMCFKAFEAEMQNELRPVEAPSPRSRPPTRRPLAPLSLEQRAESIDPDEKLKAGLPRAADRCTPSVGQENLASEDDGQFLLTKIEAEDLREKPQALQEPLDAASPSYGKVEAASGQPGDQVSSGELLTPMPSPTATPKLTAVALADTDAMPSPTATPKLTAVALADTDAMPSPTATPKLTAAALADTDAMPSPTATPKLTAAALADSDGTETPITTPSASSGRSPLALADAAGAEQADANAVAEHPAADVLAADSVEQRAAAQEEAAEETEEVSAAELAESGAAEEVLVADAAAKQAEEEEVENGAVEQQAAVNAEAQKELGRATDSRDAEDEAATEVAVRQEVQEEASTELAARTAEDQAPSTHVESLRTRLPSTELAARTAEDKAASWLQALNVSGEFEASSAFEADGPVEEPAKMAETSSTGEPREQSELGLPAETAQPEEDSVTPVVAFSKAELNEQLESAWSKEQVVSMRGPTASVEASAIGKPDDNEESALPIESSSPSATPGRPEEKAVPVDTGVSSEPAEQIEVIASATLGLAAPEPTMSVQRFLKEHSGVSTTEDDHEQACMLQNSESRLEMATPGQADATASPIASTGLKELGVPDSSSAPLGELNAQIEPVGPYWLPMPAESVQLISSAMESSREPVVNQEVPLCEKISGQPTSPVELNTGPAKASQDERPEEAGFTALEHVATPPLPEAGELQASAEPSSQAEATSSSSPLPSVEPSTSAEAAEESPHAEERVEDIDGQALLADGTLARQQKLAERRRAQQADEGDLVEEFLKAEAKCIEAALQEGLPLSPASSAEEAKPAPAAKPAPPPPSAPGPASKKSEQRAAAAQPSRRRAASQPGNSSSQVPATPRNSSSQVPPTPRNSSSQVPATSSLRRPGQAAAKASSARPRTPPRDQRASRPSARRPPPARPASVSSGANASNGTHSGAAARSLSARSPKTAAGASRSSVQTAAAASLCQGGSARHPGRDGSSRRRRIAADGGA